MKERIELPSGSSTVDSSATFVTTERFAPVSRSFAKMRTGTVAGSAPTRPTTADSASFVSVPTSWPAAAYLYVPADSPIATGLLITLEHVGVLEQQRAPADAVERVAEAPHAVAVRVGHGPDRARRDVPGGVADAERAARQQLLHRERAERPGGRRQDQPPARGRRLLERVAEARVEPGHRDRRRERAGLREHPGRPRRRRTGRARRVDGVAEDRLDRRREHDLAAVLADRLGDRADHARRPLGVGAVDRRAGEARPDARLVDRRPGRTDHDPRSRARGAVVDHVHHLDRERRDLRPAHDRVARALQPGPDVAERHHGIAGDRVRRGQEQGGDGGGDESSAHGGGA